MKGLLQFKWGRNQAQGTRFKYTELRPVLVAWALVSAYEQPLPLIFEQKIWQPLGAKDDATWLVDSKGFTFSGAGFSATLRDWARLGLLIANKGHAQGKKSSLSLGSMPHRNTMKMKEQSSSMLRGQNAVTKISFGIIHKTAKY